MSGPVATRNAKERNLIWRRSEKSTDAHAYLVKLIAAGKADAAEKFWRSYMLDTAEFMQKFLGHQSITTAERYSAPGKQRLLPVF